MNKIDKLTVLRLYPNCKVRHGEDTYDKVELLDFEGEAVGLYSARKVDGEKIVGARSTTTLVSEITPLLRPMESMTEEEREKFNAIKNEWWTWEYTRDVEGGEERRYDLMAQLIDYLRSINIDIDGLLDSGLAEKEKGE